MIDHQTASLGFELLARFDQLFPLPVDRAQLLFLLAGHAHQRERSTIALDKTFHGNELTEQRFAESNRLTIITRLKDNWTWLHRPIQNTPAYSTTLKPKR